jgi:hypothetical protein
MLPPFLLYMGVAAIVVSIATRKQAIGGWLLYFYFWIFAVAYLSFHDIILHLKVFSPSYGQGQVNHEALVLAVFPRALVYIAVAAIAVILWWRPEWVWIERLRVALLAGAIIGGFSLWLDSRYFPQSFVANGQRWIGLCFWLFYFFASRRVHHVFRTKDWESSRATGSQESLTGLR